jgi:hypothetical protein
LNDVQQAQLWQRYNRILLKGALERQFVANWMRELLGHSVVDTRLGVFEGNETTLRVPRPSHQEADVRNRHNGKKLAKTVNQVQKVPRRRCRSLDNG